MTQPDQTNWTLVLVLWVAGLGAAAQFGKIAVLYDILGLIYPGAGIGLMVSVVGLVGLVFGVSAGLVVQQLGYRRALVAALALGALMSAVQATLPGYRLMMLTRVVEGFSHLAIVVAGPVLIARVTAPRHYGAAMSLWSSFFGVSFALTFWLGMALVTATGPASLFIVHAAFMAGLAVLLGLMIPAASSTPDPAPLSMRKLARQHAEIYASPRIAAPALGFVFYTAMYVALLTLLPTRFAGADRVMVATAMPLISIMVSLTIGVWLLGRIRAVTLVQYGFALAGGAAALLWAVWGNSVLAVVAALLIAAALGLVQGASFASIPQLNHGQDDRAYAAGAVAQLGNLGTTTGTPILAWLIALFGTSGIYVFILPLAIGGILMTKWLATRRNQTA
ncbi:MAG: MFS transporter [Paracoccaceae bacterium]